MHLQELAKLYGTVKSHKFRDIKYIKKANYISTNNSSDRHL